MNLKRLFVGAASLLASFTVFAEATTSSDAMLVAKGWLDQNPNAFGEFGLAESVTAEKNAAGETLWYLVKFSNGAMVVSPDTEIEPIIAVMPISDGVIPEKHPLRAMLMGDLPQRIAIAKAKANQPRLMNTMSVTGNGAAPSPSAKWERLKMAGEGKIMHSFSQRNPDVVVKLLDGWSSPSTQGDVQTLRFWNQDVSRSYFTNDKVFNVYTPNNYYCGCVATAGAAVLHYFRVPRGRSGYEQSCMVDGETVTLSTRGGEYDWSLIDDQRLTHRVPIALSDKQVDLLGRVAYDVGVSCNMMYGEDGSGAYPSNLARGLYEAFDVESVQCVNPDGMEYYNIDSAHYPKLIYNQIRGGAPVILGINDANLNSGHEVVAAGYAYDVDKTEYTYVFLGWGGQNDAWYSLPRIDTKATAEGGWFEACFITSLITEIAPDGCHIPIVGRVVDEDGYGIEEAEVTLPNNEVVISDANGYWGGRISADDCTGEIVDPLGEGHRFAVGDLARNPDGRNAVGASRLAGALPGDFNFVIDSKSGFLRIYSDFRIAQRKAIKDGKLLYVIGGTDTNLVQDLKREMRSEADKYADFVVLSVDAKLYTTLITESVQHGCFDPRVFTPKGKWEAENGLWEEEPETWGGGEKRGVISFKLTGPNAVSASVGYNWYTYSVEVEYKDGITRKFPSELLVWSLDDDTKAKILSGELNPTKGADGTVTLKVETGDLYDPEIVNGLFSQSYTDQIIVEFYPEPIKFSQPTPENGYNLIVDGGDMPLNQYLTYVAFKGSVSPSGTNPAIRIAGEKYTAKANATVTISNNYIFKCIGYELWKDGALVESGDFDENSKDYGASGTKIKQYGVEFIVDSDDIAVKWRWVTDKCWIQTSSKNCTIDQNPQYVNYNEALTITATPPSGYTMEGTVAGWQGCEEDEILSPLQASVKADKVRSVKAIAFSKYNPETIEENPEELLLSRGYKFTLANSVGAKAKKTTVRITYDTEALMPQPCALTIGPEGGTIIVENGAAGFEYVIEGKSSLLGEWAPICSQKASVNGPLTLVVPASDAEQAFYRITVKLEE